MRSEEDDALGGKGSDESLDGAAEKGGRVFHCISGRLEANHQEEISDIALRERVEVCSRGRA